METEQQNKISLNTLLSAGFRSVREAKKFTKMYALLQIYQSVIDQNEVSAEISTLQKEWAYTELCRMNLPEGFDRLGSFDEALRWWLACR